MSSLVRQYEAYYTPRNLRVKGFLRKDFREEPVDNGCKAGMIGRTLKMDSIKGKQRRNEMIDFDSKIAELEASRSPLYKQRDALNDEIVKISKKIEKLRGLKEKEQMQQPMNTQEEVEYFLFEDGCVSGERYKARDKYWIDKGLWQSGYFPDLEQVSLKMMLYKGDKDNLEQTIKSLEEVIPFLKAKDGVKYLDIFEHTCSEYGSWSTEITDKSYDLILHRYRRKTTEKSFDNLRSLVEYVQEHHYYESSIESDDE